jgi:thiol-disulfide isomerase/thioredoxin
LHRRQSFSRRTALALLAGWPVSLPVARAMAAPPPETRQAETLLQARFVDAAGTTHRLAELTRKLLLVDLWAAWCPGCLTELPALRRLAERLGPDAIDVVMLSHGMNWAGDLAYASRTGIPFHHWRLAPNTPDSVVTAAFRIDGDRFGLPQSLVLAGQQRVLVGATIGTSDWSSPEQIRLARTWLDASG